MNYAIILAGGRGMRFWPLSRESTPKQFLNICSGRPMIENTVNRISGLIDKGNIYVATNKKYKPNIRQYLKGLNINSRNIFFEPESRNTLGSIALLSKRIYQKDKDAVIAVLPSDHYIKDSSGFLMALCKAFAVASRGYIVTFGIKPNRPETGYGYIKIKSKVISQKSKVYLIDKFIEKPSLLRAKAFIKDKRFYWNGGVFIFKAEVMLSEIRKQAPKDYSILEKIKDDRSLNKFWGKFSPVSIDYAIMEKTKAGALIPAGFDWLDIGSWQAVEYFFKKDSCGNIFRGNCIDIASKNSLVWSEGPLTATLGLEDAIVVNTKDALLVCHKDMAQEVKEIVKILKQRNFKKEI